MLVARILRRKHALECNRPIPVDVLARAPTRLLATPASFSAYAAASGMAVAHKRRSEAQAGQTVAIALGLTAHGVRRHLRNLFTRPGVDNGAEAVRRARELRLIHEDVRTGGGAGGG